MLKIPLLSIIIPVYNSGKYIRKCLESIFEIVEDCIEIIIIDDGSTDESISICNEFCKKYSSISIFSQKNKGVSAARNYGLKMSHGKYISFIDSDDWIDGSKYDNVISLLEKDEYDIVSYNMIKTSKENNYKVPFRNRSMELNYIYYPVYMHSVCNKVFRRRFLQINEIVFNNDIRYSEDLLFTLECYIKSSSVYFMNEYIYYYRTNSESATQNINVVNLINNEMKVSAIIGNILQNNNQVNQFKKYMTHRNTSVAMYYLIEPSIYSVDEYRRINNVKAGWYIKKEIVHCLLCFTANHSMDMINDFYIKHKF